VIGVFHRPLAPGCPGQSSRVGLLSREAGDKAARVLGGFAVLLEGGGVAGVEDLAGGGKGQRIRFDRRPAYGAGFDAATAGFGLDKRGVAPVSFCWVLCRTVGWLSLTPRT